MSRNFPNAPFVLSLSKHTSPALFNQRGPLNPSTSSGRTGMGMAGVPKSKLQNWRGFRAIFARKGAWMLGFVFLLPGVAQAASPASPSVPQIQMRIDVHHGYSPILRDLITVTPLEPFYKPVVLDNGQPAVLRCESRFVERGEVRTSCQFLSGSENPAFSKMRWADSPFGGQGKISFQDVQGKHIDVFVAPLKPGKKS